MEKEVLSKYLKNAKGHFLVVMNHKKGVMEGCFHVGLYWQGLTHDLSKFSPDEFLVGIKYFQGTRSPNAAEREDTGYSRAWMHHKGRNKHHFEYWTDVDQERTRCLAGMKMPVKYLAEMVMDRVAATKTYQGANYKVDSPLNYLLRGRDKETMNPETYEELLKILTILAEHGEAAMYSYVRSLLRRGSY